MDCSLEIIVSNLDSWPVFGNWLEFGFDVQTIGPSVPTEGQLRRVVLVEPIDRGVHLRVLVNIWIVGDVVLVGRGLKAVEALARVFAAGFQVGVLGAALHVVRSGR